MWPEFSTILHQINNWTHEWNSMPTVRTRKFTFAQFFWTGLTYGISHGTLFRIIEFKGNIKIDQLCDFIFTSYTLIDWRNTKWIPVFGSLNSKKTWTIPLYVWSYNWVKPTWGQPCGSKTRMGKKLFWTFIFHGQLILTNTQPYRHCLPLTKDKKENCQKIRNLDEVFHNRLRVLSRRELGWPANWRTCQSPWWLQNTVSRYRSSLFRVQWFGNWSKHLGWVPGDLKVILPRGCMIIFIN